MKMLWNSVVICIIAGIVITNVVPMIMPMSIIGLILMLVGVVLFLRGVYLLIKRIAVWTASKVPAAAPVAVPGDDNALDGDIIKPDGTVVMPPTA